MQDDTRDRELIQGFIEGNLTTPEQSEVSYRLKEDKGFVRLYAEYEQLALGIRYAHLNKKLFELRTLEAGLPPVNENVIQLRQYWLPLATAAAIIISLGVWFTLSVDSTPLNQKLYAQYFEPFDSPGSGLTRSNDDVESARGRAYVAYDAKKYEEATLLLADAIKEKDDAIMDLCLGNSWLALNKPDNAEKVFQHMLQNHNDLVTQAKWYLALTYLNQGKIERTKATLWEISNSSTYGEEARKLIKALD